MTLLQQQTSPQLRPGQRYGRGPVLAPQGARRPWAYPAACWLGAALVAAAVIAVVVSLVSGSSQAWDHYGLGFLWSGTFNPTNGQYATGDLIVGTLVTTGLAMVVAVPVGLGAAIALSEVLPTRLASVVAGGVDLLAG